MADVEIPGKDWTRLRKSKLFFVPEVHRAYVDGAFAKTDLVKAAEKWGGRDTVSISVVSSVCDLDPVSYEKAEASIKAYNSVMKERGRPLGKEAIICAVFAFRFPKALLDREARVIGIDRGKLASLAGLHKDTVENFMLCGRVTAFAAAKLASALKASVKTESRADGLSEDARGLLSQLSDEANPRSLFTSLPKAGALGVRTNGDAECLIYADDLIAAPPELKNWK